MRKGGELKAQCKHGGGSMRLEHPALGRESPPGAQSIPLFGYCQTQNKGDLSVMFLCNLPFCVIYSRLWLSNPSSLPSNAASQVAPATTTYNDYQKQQEPTRKTQFKQRARPEPSGDSLLPRTIFISDIPCESRNTPNDQGFTLPIHVLFTLIGLRDIQTIIRS
jgi:hypothetical protein